MNGDDIGQLTDKQLLVRIYTKVEGIETTLLECPKRELRIKKLELKESRRAGIEESESKSSATGIALIALAISVLATIANILT